MKKKEAEQIVIYNKNIREIVISHCNVEYDIVVTDCLIKRDVVVRRNVIGGEVKVNMNSELSMSKKPQVDKEVMK